MDSDPEVSVPLAVRLTLGRAAVQVIADAAGARVLHIKGEAVDASLRRRDHIGSDVDLLIDPGAVDAFDRALRGHGWRIYSSFVWGSPFGHGQTYFHPVWGYLDAHRFFPGIRVRPADAFESFFDSSYETGFGRVPCRVPSLLHQSVILVLNAARGGDDLRDVWDEASPQRRREMQEAAKALGAQVAFAAATGRLEEHRGAPDYALWKVVTEGGSRSAEWRARVRAAQSAGEALRILARAPLVNVEHLSHTLGRPATRGEVFREFFGRPIRAWRSSGTRGGAR